MRSPTSDFTLIGTTDAEHHGDPRNPTCTPEECDYLLDFANDFFKQTLNADDVVWTYSGVRRLYDDGAKSATATTRDYVLSLDDASASGGAPMLNVFGGKITTYRVLAEDAWAKLARSYPQATGNWTAGVPLPGGDFPVDGVPALIADLRAAYPFLTEPWAKRLIRAYGTEAWLILGAAKTAADLGRDVGATLTEAELGWLTSKEYAREVADVIWRRSKLGLRLSPAKIAGIAAFMAASATQA